MAIALAGGSPAASNGGGSEEDRAKGRHDIKTDTAWRQSFEELRGFVAENGVSRVVVNRVYYLVYS